MFIYYKKHKLTPIMYTTSILACIKLTGTMQNKCARSRMGKTVESNETPTVSVYVRQRETYEACFFSAFLFKLKLKLFVYF